MEDLGSPSSYLELVKSAACYSSDGELVGTVEEVRAAPDQDIFDGIVLQAAGARRFVGAEDVEEIFERGVLLKIDRAAAESLPPPAH